MSVVLWLPSLRQGHCLASHVQGVQVLAQEIVGHIVHLVHVCVALVLPPWNWKLRITKNNSLSKIVKSLFIVFSLIFFLLAVLHEHIFCLVSQLLAQVQGTSKSLKIER